jgi:hypothetical protein
VSLLIFEIYCEELGQHKITEDHKKIDKLHETNVYVLAKDGEEIAGMFAITLPKKAEFSTLKRMTVHQKKLIEKEKTIEIRLLAVKKKYRVAAHLFN